MKYDPDNAQIYKQNAERYKAKIRQMADPLRAELEKNSRRSALAGHQ